MPVGMSNAMQWNSTICSRCQNLASCRTQIVLATPCQPGGLLAVGEAPGADEDLKGIGFIGTAGKTLDRLLAVHGIARNDYGRANICRCRPPENRKPTAKEISACLPFLADVIQTFKPKVIVAVGGTPTAVFCGKGSLYSRIMERQHSTNWSVAVGQRVAHIGIRQALEHVSFVVPMPHTSPLAFNRDAPSGEKWAVIAERQIAIAAKLLNK